jgi:riboflavin kinase/FMN adenylyltransferase
MELIRGTVNLRAQHNGSVVTIGNFDGVHRGHRAVLDGLKKRGEVLDLPTCVMTFEPLPLEYFAPEKAPVRLISFRDKYQILQTLGVDWLFVMPFNARLANSSAEDFIRDVLVDGLGAKHVVVGDDFRFGHQRRGDFEMLGAHGRKFGFSVEPTVTYRQDAQRISSSRVRVALSTGDLDLAENLLGRPFTIEGRIMHGDRRGRTIGYPTANVHLHRQHTPVKGIFAVEAITADGRNHNGMASLGTRPTVTDSNHVTLEVNLFDFSGDIYHQRLRVVFRHYIRGEQKFNSLEELANAIAGDEIESRRYFAELGG